MSPILPLALSLLLSASVHASQQAAGSPDNLGPLLPRDGRDAAVFRGAMVYGNYCVTCHGINADGKGRAARLYKPPPANLRSTDKNEAYVLAIVRQGGKAMGRSEFMPPWGEELTDEQMRDVAAYVRTISAPAAGR